MIKFTATLLQFNEQGEKTGWTYFVIPAKIATQLKPNNKKSFRVKGKLDDFEIEKVALMPMGEGNFIMAFNAAMRKGTSKRKGATIKVQLQQDAAPIVPPAELIACMEDEPEALKYFNTLPQGHRNYFTKWIDTAKTDVTKAKRIALVIKTMVRKMDFGAMLREERENKRQLGR